MNPTFDDPIGQHLEEQHRDASLRGESLGPLVEAVGFLRASCQAVRLLLDELETRVGVHLELLDAVLVACNGSRWWDHLRDGDERPGDR